MAKRFTDTEKYKKSFMRGLPFQYKLFWDYLYHDCSFAGIWYVDFEVAQIRLGHDAPINKDDALKFFNKDEERVVVFNGGKKWFLRTFVEFQYGELSSTNKLHLGVMRELEKEGVSIPLKYPFKGAKVKDKVKDIKGVIGGKTKSDISMNGAWPFFENVEFNKAFSDYISMRSKIKKPATIRAQELVLKDLHKVSIETAVEMLHQSIRHSWTDVYPPKKNDISQGQLTSGDLEKTIERSLGKMATKDMIKNVLRGIPQNLWWKVDKFLQKRYPHDTRSNFTEAERELVVEIRGSKDCLNKLTASIG